MNALYSYWADHPPVHITVAGMLGHKPRKQTNISGLIAMFEGGVIK